MEIRAATVEDADAIARLHLASWRTHFRGLVPDPVLDGLDDLQWRERRRTHLGDPIPGVSNRVALRDGVVVAWGAWGPARDPGLGAETFELYALYADPEHVGTGAGRALMQDALRAPGEARWMTLWTLRDNELSRRFYRAAGFADDDRVPTQEFHGAVSIRMVRAL